MTPSIVLFLIAGVLIIVVAVYGLRRPVSKGEPWTQARKLALATAILAGMLGGVGWLISL